MPTENGKYTREEIRRLQDRVDRIYEKCSDMDKNLYSLISKVDEFKVEMVEFKNDFERHTDSDTKSFKEISDSLQNSNITINTLNWKIVLVALASGLAGGGASAWAIVRGLISP